MSLDHFIYRTKYHMGKYLPLRVPVDVSLELSSACNMACGYCYHGKPESLPFKRNFMKLDVAKLIIGQAAKMGVNSLKFNWRGESTLNPHFPEITKYAKSLAGGSTFIDRITNSNFNFPRHNKDKIIEGLCNQTKVKVSLDSFNKKVMETQRKGSKFNLILENINSFYDLKDHNTELVIQAVRTKLNQDEDLEGKIKEHWPEAKASIRDVVEGRHDEEIQEYAIRHRDKSLRSPCKQAFVRIVFDSYGFAYPCCVDWKNQARIGHIHAGGLRAIFNGIQARELRIALKNKTAFDNDPCKNCSSYESYKGFKANWNS